MARAEKDPKTDSRDNGAGRPDVGKTALARTIAAAVVAIAAVLIATGGFGLLNGNGVQPGREAEEAAPQAQTVAPSADDKAKAADEVERLKPLAPTSLADATAVSKLAAALPLSDKGPEVQTDAAGHALTVSFTGIDDETGKKAASDGALDADLLHAAVGYFTCIEELQRLTFNIAGGESYTLRRSAIEQSFGQPINASSALTKEDWAEILRKIGTEGFASSLMGLSTASGQAAAGQTVGGSAPAGSATAQ